MDSLLLTLQQFINSPNSGLATQLIDQIRECLGVERNKQEMKSHLEVIIRQLVLNSSDFDQQTEQNLLELLQELTSLGQNTGKWVVSLMNQAEKNYQLHLKLFEYLQVIFLAASKMRKAHIATLLAQYFNSFQNEIPLHIKESVNSLSELIIGFLPEIREPIPPLPVPCSSYQDKFQIFKAWIQSPSENLVKGFKMHKFLAKQVNFEVLIDLVLFYPQHSESALNSLMNKYSFFQKNKKFQVEPKIMQCISDALMSNSQPFLIIQSCKLLRIWSSQPYSNILPHLARPENLKSILIHIQYPQIQTLIYNFLQVHKNETEKQQRIKSSFFSPFFSNLISIMQSNSYQRKIGAAQILQMIIPKFFVKKRTIKCDQLDQPHQTQSLSTHLSIFLQFAKQLFTEISRLAFREPWIPEDSKQIQNLKEKYSRLFSSILQQAHTYPKLKNLLQETILATTLQDIQSTVIHLSLNTEFYVIRLNAYQIQRPAGIQTLAISQCFLQCLKVCPESASKASVNCFAILSLWMDVFKTNGVLLNYICQAFDLFFKYASGKAVNELLVSKSFQKKVITDLKHPYQGPQYADFNWATRKLWNMISPYAESNKNKLVKQTTTVSERRNWASSFQTDGGRRRVASKSSRRCRPVQMIGSSRLKIFRPKTPPKQEYTVESLAQQLDRIYPISK